MSPSDARARLAFAEVCGRRLQRRGRADLLPGDDPAVAAAAMCGAHAQVMSAAELSVGLRLADVTVCSVRAALWEHGTLAKTVGPGGLRTCWPPGTCPTGSPPSPPCHAAAACPSLPPDSRPTRLRAWSRPSPTRSRRQSSPSRNSGRRSSTAPAPGPVTWSCLPSRRCGHAGVRRSGLLPYFDAYAVGCHPRERLFPGAAAERALARGQAGNRPVLLVDGVVAGGVAPPPRRTADRHHGRAAHHAHGRAPTAARCRGGTARRHPRGRSGGTRRGRHGGTARVASPEAGVAAATAPGKTAVARRPVRSSAPGSRLDGQDGAGRVEEHLLGGAAHEELPHGRAAAQADDEEVRVSLSHDPEDLLGRG